MGTVLPEADITLRTPDRAVSACQQACTSDTGPTVTAAIAFALRYGGGTIEVSPPWHISLINETAIDPDQNAICPPSYDLYTLGQCADTGNDQWIIWTDDPNPPARNIVIRTGRSCPD